jgi:hypothetical protein
MGPPDLSWRFRKAQMATTSLAGSWVEPLGGACLTQLHLNGVRTGDPNVAAPHDGRPFDRDGPPGEVYFLIVGCGLANLTLVAQGEFPAGPAVGRLETEGRFPRLQQFPVA